MVGEAMLKPGGKGGARARRGHGMREATGVLPLSVISAWKNESDACRGDHASRWLRGEGATVIACSTEEQGVENKNN